MVWGTGGYSVKILPLHTAVNHFSSHCHSLYLEVQCNDWYYRMSSYRSIMFTSYLLSSYPMSMSTFFCISHSSSQTTKNHYAVRYVAGFFQGHSISALEEITLPDFTWSYFNPLPYTAGCETQFRDQPNITAQQGYVLKSIKINFAWIKYKCTKLPFLPKN